MSENPLLVYLKYVRDVLGVNQMISESSESHLRDHFFHPDPELHLEKKWDIIFINTMFTSLESLFESDNASLFQKMLGAMNLEGFKVLSVDTDLFHEREIVRRWKSFGLPKVMIIFKDNPEISEGLRLVDDTAVIETYGPYHLRHHPEFKKMTWNHLQKVMQHLGLKN